MTAKGEPKLLFPGLAGFYEAVSDLWYPMIRVAIGAILFMHGYAKLARGPAHFVDIVHELRAKIAEVRGA